MKKNSAINLIFLLAIFGSLFSCTKVIQVDLNSASPQLVVDGSISDQPGPYTVTLSQTVNFNQSNIFPPVSGVLVIISDNAGNRDTLKEILPGSYQTSSLKGVPGRIYTLTIQTDKGVFTSVCAMPKPVVIDSLTVKNGFRSKDKIIWATFRDPAGIDNYYRFKERVFNPENDSIMESNFGSITTDRLYDGTTMTYSLSGGQPDLTKGDSVIVSLQCIDKHVYEYFRTARQQGSTSTSLSNPVSNISNHALGYFSAYSVRFKTIVIR